jgi:hypothetical protein
MPTPMPIGGAGLDLLGELRQLAAQLDLQPRLAGGLDRGLQPLVRLVAQLAGLLVVLDLHERGVPVVGHEPDRLRIDRRHDAGHGAEALDEVGDDPLFVGGGKVAVVGVDDHLGAATRGLGEALGEHVERLLRLDARDAEVVGVGAARAGGAGPQEGGGRQPGDEDGAAPADREPPEAVECLGHRVEAR